jgi:hypothetical protein
MVDRGRNTFTMTASQQLIRYDGNAPARGASVIGGSRRSSARPIVAARLGASARGGSSDYRSS